MTPVDLPQSALFMMRKLSPLLAALLFSTTLVAPVHANPPPPEVVQEILAMLEELRAQIEDSSKGSLGCVQTDPFDTVSCLEPAIEPDFGGTIDCIKDHLQYPLSTLACAGTGYACVSFAADGWTGTAYYVRGYEANIWAAGQAFSWSTTSGYQPRPGFGPGHLGIATDTQGGCP